MSAYALVLLKALAVPPGAQAVLGLCGLAFYRSRRALGIVLMMTSCLSIAVLGMPQTASWLAMPLENAPPIALGALAGRKVDAIVVLGGGANQHVREANGADDVSTLTLERLRYAARLHRETGLPLAVTGGLTGNLRQPEGVLMARSLEADFSVPVRYRELESVNTAENATFSRQRFNFETVVLVTHAVHMPRARRAFESAGMTVIPAPMGFISRPAGSAPTPLDFLPTIKGFVYSQYAIYEWLGALWYRASYR